VRRKRLLYIKLKKSPLDNSKKMVYSVESANRGFVYMIMMEDENG